jgi:CHASE3 domain sensor protein
MHDDAFFLAHAHEVLAALDNLLVTAKDVETGQGGFLITGDESYLKRYDHALGRLQALCRVMLVKRRPRRYHRVFKQQ